MSTPDTFLLLLMLSTPGALVLTAVVWGAGFVALVALIAAVAWLLEGLGRWWHRRQANRDRWRRADAAKRRYFKG